MHCRPYRPRQTRSRRTGGRWPARGARAGGRRRQANGMEAWDRWGVAGRNGGTASRGEGNRLAPMAFTPLDRVQLRPGSGCPVSRHGGSIHGQNRQPVEDVSPGSFPEGMKLRAYLMRINLILQDAAPGAGQSPVAPSTIRRQPRPPRTPSIRRGMPQTKTPGRSRVSIAAPAVRRGYFALPWLATASAAFLAASGSPR